MKILFLYKGPKNPIIDSQESSISGKGVHVIKFPIKITDTYVN